MNGCRGVRTFGFLVKGNKTVKRRLHNKKQHQRCFWSQDSVVKLNEKGLVRGHTTQDARNYLRKRAQ